MRNENRPTGRPTKQEAERLGERILDEARAMFGANGISRVSLDEIASRLCVSKHTIYRRYPGKAALIEAVVARDLSRFRQSLAAASDEAQEPIDKVRSIARRYVAFGATREYAAFYLSLSAEAAVVPELRERLAEWSASALEPLTMAITIAQQAGVLRDEDPPLIRDVLVDLLEGVNNRARLAAGVAPDIECLFAERWGVFIAALATPAEIVI